MDKCGWRQLFVLLKTVIEHCLECLEVGQELNALETKAGNVKACEPRPIPKGKALLIPSYLCDLTMGPKVHRPTRAKLIRPRLSKGGVLPLGCGGWSRPKTKLIRLFRGAKSHF